MNRHFGLGALRYVKARAAVRADPFPVVLTHLGCPPTTCRPSGTYLTRFGAWSKGQSSSSAIWVSDQGWSAIPAAIAAVVGRPYFFVSVWWGRPKL